MKNIISILVFLTILNVSVISVTAQENIQITSGMYFQLGKYNDEPIVWKSLVTDNENGVLLFSDKIICNKAFNVDNKEAFDSVNVVHNYGSSFWEDSTLRIWLNSSANAGEVEWIPGYEPTRKKMLRSSYPPKIFGTEEGWGAYAYADEKGFLNNDNFTKSEKSVIKTVSQWQALSEDKCDLSTNGMTKPFRPIIIHAPYSQFEEIWYRYKLPELGKAYYGAMYRLTDTMFVLDESQLYNIWEQFGSINADTTSSVVTYGEYDKGVYWLRTPFLNNCVMVGFNDDGYEERSTNVGELGVRPAFYLNEENMIIKSGNGTEDDPYVIDGVQQQGTAVFCNGEQVQFDEQPIEESDRILVPMRAIFEDLGASVDWNGNEESITITNDATTIEMQIDNNIMQIDDTQVTLDVPPRLIGERTLVPLRAVSEALNAKVDYIENLNRVVIDPPQPEETEEGHWQSQAEIIEYGAGKK